MEDEKKRKLSGNSDHASEETANATTTVESRTRKRKEKPVLERPKYLNWRIYDNPEKIDTMDESKLFYDGRLAKPLTPLQKYQLKKAAYEFRERWVPAVKKWEAEVTCQKTHLRVAGGNYTLDFALSRLIRSFYQRHRHEGIHLKLFESFDVELLKAEDIDILLTGEYEGRGFDRKELEAAGYIVMKQSIEDEVYFAATQDVINEYGGIEQTLKYADLLIGRVYETKNGKEAVKVYPGIPVERARKHPRIITDSYFMEFMMMCKHIGIASVYKTMSLPPNVVILTEPYEKFRRYVVIKKNLVRKFRWIPRYLIHLLQHPRG